MAGNARPLLAVLLGLAAASSCGAAALQSRAPIIPDTEAVALDGQHLALPKDLPAPANILIIGFGRHSKDATTAWEIPVRTQLAKSGSIGFYDIAMIAEIPGLVRPMVMRAIRHDVPDVLKPNFLPLTEGENAWKRVAGYAADQPEAAYLVLVDRTGHVRWTTHAAYSPAEFAELQRVSANLARSTP